MHNPKIIKQYREQLLTLHAVTELIVSLVEIIGYIIFVSLGIQKLSFKDAYLWQGVIIPIIINAVTHSGARAVVKSETAKAERQNASVIYAAFVTAFEVSFFHRDYIIDRAEYVNCHERCVGLSYVILGGEVVVKDAVFCGNKKGRFIPDEERFES